ncbi:MAG: ribonuclease H-like domain-containing protein [Planctomycetota bacterium]
MSGFLAFDIETYGAWSALSPRMQDYLSVRDRHRGLDPQDSRAAPQTVGLLPGLAQVIAVGLWAPGLERVLFLDPGREADAQEPLPDGGELHTFADEARLLGAFWTAVAEARQRGARLVSFRGRGFDVPMLVVRSTVLGVAPTAELGTPGSLAPHCDLHEVLGFDQARRPGFSLDYWCEVYGVASPKDGLSGDQVAAAYEAGRFAEIARYALADARATGQVFERLAPWVAQLEAR